MEEHAGYRLFRWRSMGLCFHDDVTERQPILSAEINIAVVLGYRCHTVLTL